MFVVLSSFSGMFLNRYPLRFGIVPAFEQLLISNVTACFMSAVGDNIHTYIYTTYIFLQLDPSSCQLSGGKANEVEWLIADSHERMIGSFHGY